MTDRGLLMRILNWVLSEQLVGREPTSVEVGKAFEMTPDEAEAIQEELARMGEFD